MTLTLLLLIIPVIGSVVGLIGKSWDDSKTSTLKFTTRGWISLAVIIAALVFSAYKTIKTQQENDNLKEQRNKVRSLVYNKIYHDCLSAIRPIEQIYSEQRNKSEKYVFVDHYELLLEMMSNRGRKTFESINLLDSVESGTAFEEWDKSYADYLHGYYNSKYPYNLEITMTRWANYIDMEDLLIIDSIINHGYWISLQNINCGNTKNERDEYIRKVGVLYYFDDEDTIENQKDFLSSILKLMKKSKEYIEKPHSCCRINF